VTATEFRWPDSLHDVVDDGIEGCCCHLTVSGAARSCGLCILGEHTGCQDAAARRRKAEQ